MSSEGWIYVRIGSIVTRFKISPTAHRCVSCGRQACVIVELWDRVSSVWCESCWQEIPVDAHLIPDEIVGVKGYAK